MTTDPAKHLTELVEQHYAGLYRFAFRLSGCASEAEDLVQETFCKAHAKWHQLRQAESGRSWLYSILRNLYLIRWRERRRQREVALDESLEPPTQAVPDEWPAVEPAQLQAALNELPEEFRTPLILFYFEEFSYKEIADQMGIPLGTVMSRLARAKAQLRQFLLAAEASRTPLGSARAIS